MTEVLFYHLERLPLEKVLPVLVEKSLERGWRAVIEVGQPERIAGLDTTLWTYRDDSFLPHAVAGSQADADQPVLLTDRADNPNGADIRFFVGGAVPRTEAGGESAYKRMVYLFDGHDPDAVAEARKAWKALRTGHDVTYWQQDSSGRWSKKA